MPTTFRPYQPEQGLLLLLNLPAGVSGIVEIKSRQSERFGALGLRYTGQVFTTIPAN